MDGQAGNTIADICMVDGADRQNEGRQVTSQMLEQMCGIRLPKRDGVRDDAVPSNTAIKRPLGIRRATDMCARDTLLAGKIVWRRFWPTHVAMEPFSVSTQQT